MKIKKNLKRLLSKLVVFTFISTLLPTNFIETFATGTERKVQILATTDLHGKFVPYEYARATKSDGGLTQIATLIEQQRNLNENTIVVDNGDTIQGNYNHLFLSDPVNPMVLAMDEIGYDSYSFGNHEFNFGMDKLFEITTQSKNANIAALCANLYKDGVRVFDAYNMETMPNGIKIATIGVVTPHINKWDGPNLVGYVPTNPVTEVAKVIDEIKAAGGADVYVVTAHMGFDEEYGNDSAKEVAEGNPEVDVVIMGHSHDADKVREAGNALLIQPTNSGGSLGKVEVTLSDNGTEYTVKSKTHEFLSTKGVEEALGLATKLDSYHQRALADASTIIGTLEGEDLADANEIQDIPESIVEDQGITDFVNEVQLYNSAKHLKALGINSEEVYLVSGAALFDANSNMKAGDIKKSDISNIYKYDNKLYTIKTNGKQLKAYLEWTASIYNTFNEGDLTVSLNQDIRLYQYDMLDGVSYEINVSKEAGNRIENLKFEKDGKEVSDTDVVYLSVNNYRYDSRLNAVGSAIFEPGTHEKIHDTNNDYISDMRDLIIDYIINVKGGTVTRSIDNNWKLTGFEYDKELRAELVKLVNEGKLSIPKSQDGRTPNVKSLTINDVLVANGTKKVELLHFNDLHGNVEESGKNIGVAKLAAAIKAKTSMNNFSNYEAIPLAAGDLYQGTAISNLTHGAPVTEFLKEINVLASSVGNHEFDWGRELIPGWATDGGFDFLAANIVYKNTGEIVEWVKPYLVTEVDGVKIGLIGVATPETAVKTTPANVADLDFTDPIAAVNKYKDILRNDEKVDVVVVLSHLGANENKGNPKGEAIDLANGIKDGVDAIIAAHDHQFTNVEVNGIKIVQAGYNGRGLGSIIFNFDSNNNLLGIETKVDSLFERVNDLKVDETVKSMVAGYKESLSEILDEKVTDLEIDLGNDKYDGLTPLGIVVAETMRKLAEADIAITNGGGIRAPLSKGVLTIGDLYTILPFDNTLYTMELKGSDIVKALEHGIMPGNMGWGQFSGIKVWYDETAEAGSRVTSVRFMDGTPLDMETYYKVVVNDFMASGGDGYDFSNARNMYDTNIVMRDGIIEDWKTNGVNVEFEDLLIKGIDDTIEEDKDKDIDIDKDEDKDTDKDTNTDKENGKGNLPNTGEEGFKVFLVIAVISLVAGIELIRKKEKTA